MTTDTEIVTEGQDAAVAEAGGALQPYRRHWRRRVVIYGISPAVALLLACTAGYLKWVATTSDNSPTAVSAPVRAAAEGAAAILSYRPDTAEKDLGAATERLTGSFKDSYNTLTHDVVIPGAKQKQVSAVATVPAAAAVSATQNHAVVLVFVDQSTVIGGDPPTNTTSRVRVTLDKIGTRWLISGFDPM